MSSHITGRRGCCREYLDLRGRKWQEAGEDCIMRSFITCTVKVKVKGKFVPVFN
jgi:hypothetical protein